ncbi:CocE/NonD family hydrolase [Paraburkholderia megapolitana]|uniref:Predicted acyl esterase n=1 Tax=Paraburkholderia megapolitana TaxID=420953 RepID=A0A1I3E096_9BURK|nr:CocE/NonD family hydrolase [Paraburkholderia megapolitana]QDQ79860.1 X-Pro dipeptidyl-peptidase [Paraburkholderia megapolitana]SFH92412.1 Predicted acyl esterase [Paraburkholderia megapolitana]
MRKFTRYLAAWTVALMFASPVWAATFSATYQRIASWDGTQLGAVVLLPQGQGSGPFPLVVMPASWGAPNLEYVGRGAEMAANGYVVVSYTSRGFFDSQGSIDIAGPDTVKDVSAVIDWALVNTPANPKAIGVSGISYGAGLGLLAAERDPRIKAVASLSTWADLLAALDANRTPSAQALAVLGLGGAVTGRAGPLLASVDADLLAGNYDAIVTSMTPDNAIRSPASDVSKLNANGAAILVANSFDDGLFPPGQLVDLFQNIKNPKQMMFSQGDHATAEVPGALGLPNDVYTAVGRWFDRYLKGVQNGVEKESVVKLRSQDSVWHGYADWSAVQAGATHYYLGGPRGLLLPTGQLASSASTGWNSSIFTALPTVASSGIVEVSGFLQSLGQPPAALIPLVSRLGAGVWAGPKLATAQRLDGMSMLHVTVTPSQANTSLYAYLYSVDGYGNGQLVSYKPYTLRNATPNLAVPIDVRLEANSWNIPAGNQLVLVVGTVDFRYAGVTQAGGVVSFSSPQGDPSTLTVPLH